MIAFEIDELLSTANLQTARYDEFLRRASMSVGIYHLPAGATDPQQPHREDEAYFVLEGKGCISVGDEDRIVNPGSFVFVEKGVDHRFHTIQESMKVLVFFAPAES